MIPKYHTIGMIPKSHRKITETEAKWITWHTHTWPLTFLAWHRYFSPMQSTLICFIQEEIILLLINFKSSCPNLHIKIINSDLCNNYNMKYYILTGYTVHRG
jgi:hypothetical protein